MPKLDQTNAQGKKPTGPPRRKMLDAHKIWSVFAALARASTAFSHVREIFTPEVARSIGDIYYAYYSVLYEFYDANAGLPNHQFLKDGVEQFLAAHPELLTDEEKEQLDALVAEAWSYGPTHEATAEEPQNIKHLVDLVKLLYQDYMAKKIRDTLVDDAQGLVPVDMGAQLVEYEHKVQSALSLGASAVKELCPTGWENEEPPVRHPLGVPLFDHYMEGGLADGETMLFVAPTGSCKSVVTCMMAALLAQKARELHAARNFSGPTPIIMVASFEEPVQELRTRIFAHIARVVRARAELPVHKLYDTFMPIHEKDNENWYERTEFKMQAEGLSPPPKSERQRILDAASAIQHYVRILDFTGEERMKRGGNYGCGGAIEVAQNVHMYRRENAIVPTFLLVDHLAAMVANMQEIASKVDGFWLRNNLELAPRLFQQHVAQPMHCPVMMTHQISGASCKLSPATPLDHTLGKDCSTIATYCNFAFWAGNVGVEDQLTQFGCSKRRRNKPMAHSRIRVDGAYNRIIDVSKEVEVIGGRFVKQTSAAVVGKAPKPTQASNY